MTEADLRSKASANVSADAVSDRHAAVRFELALAIEGRGSLAEHGTRAAQAVGARVQTVIPGVVRIDPLCRGARSASEENEDGTDAAHVHILASPGTGCGTVYAQLSSAKRYITIRGSSCTIPGCPS
jgi:hypothetical protein